MNFNLVHIVVHFHLHLHSAVYCALGFGLACHLGVLSDIPCVGVAKKLFLVDGLEKGPKHKHRVSMCVHACLTFFLRVGKQVVCCQ